ncbi:MAG TPA: tRNA (adenosine(37)-N6)-dimethylallyltransferase MiaA [Gaiellaceae bacterium]|nr:tRNA (adenosine(37)-N6)-dimethylallyltransferase MiaA [Gaiellaceae bacterium]
MAGRRRSSPSDPLVLALFGPTASGKSAVAEALAELTPAETVSADSMQVYRGLPILTNQPAMETTLVAIWDLDHEASVAEYAELAHAAIDGALEAGRTPVVVGGTGLYFRAALAELDVPPAPPPGARQRWNRVYDWLGPEGTHAALAARDSVAAATVHPNDRRRVVRALELNDAGSSLRPGQDRLWTGETRQPTFVVGLEMTREELARRIDERAREMLRRGAAEEARAALAGPISSTASKVIGLREAAELPPDEAIAAIALRTRQYAAYQRKWMRRIPGLVSVRGDRAPRDTALEILDLASRRKPLSARRPS